MSWRGWHGCWGAACCRALLLWGRATDSAAPMPAAPPLPQVQESDEERGGEDEALYDFLSHFLPRTGEPGAGAAG